MSYVPARKDDCIGAEKTETKYNKREMQRQHRCDLVELYLIRNWSGEILLPERMGQEVMGKRFGDAITAEK